MAAQYYLSSNGGDAISAELDHTGTSSTATDLVELRIGDGTTIPTQRRVLNILEQFERHIMSNGVIGDGANLPADRG